MTAAAASAFVAGFAGALAVCDLAVWALRRRTQGLARGLMGACLTCGYE